MIPIAYKTIQAVDQRPVILSVWLVTPHSPGKKPRASWSVQPVSSKTKVAAIGAKAHLNRVFKFRNWPFRQLDIYPFSLSEENAPSAPKHHWNRGFVG